MSARRLVRIVRELGGQPIDDPESERRTSSRVDFFVWRAIDEALLGVEPEWGPITPEEALIMGLRLLASSPPTSEPVERSSDEIELCAGGWQVPDRWRRFRTRRE